MIYLDKKQSNTVLGGTIRHRKGYGRESRFVRCRMPLVYQRRPATEVFLHATHHGSSLELRSVSARLTCMVGHRSGSPTSLLNKCTLHRALRARRSISVAQFRLMATILAGKKVLCPFFIIKKYGDL